MAYLDIEVKNYRCFEDRNPLRLRVGDGFTALLGTNNSGKSSVLKMFFELREVFSLLLNYQELANRLTGTYQGFNVQEVYDQVEIFSSLNDRNISISIDFSSFLSEYDIPIDQNYICGFDLTIFRGSSFSIKPHTFMRRTGDISKENFVSSVASSPLQTNVGTVWSEGLVRVIEILSRILYIPPFRNAINDGSASHYGLAVGVKFIEVWQDWREGANIQRKRRIRQVTDDIKELFNFESLDISASAQLKTLNVTVNGSPRTLRELGAGIAQFILVLGNAAISNPSMIFIDEPELHLHPEKQVKFLAAISRHAPNGTVFATHSIGLARSSAERIYFLNHDGNRSIVHNLEAVKSYSELLGELSFSSIRELGCSKVLLVEGASEVKAIQQLLRKLGKDTECLVVPLGGAQLIRGNVGAELDEFKRLNLPVSVLIDSEKNGPDEELSHDRREFSRLCKQAGFNILVLSRRATENYFPQSAIQATFGENFRALANYDKLESQSKYGWSKSDNWRIFQNTNIQDLVGTDLLEFLQAI